MDISDKVQSFEADLKAQNNMIIRIDTTLELMRSQLESLTASVNALVQNMNQRINHLETRVTAIEIAMEERCEKRQQEIHRLSNHITHIRLSQAKFAGICAACSALGASLPFIFNYLLKI